MQFWEGGVVQTGLIIGVLLLAAELLRRLIPAIGRIGLPGSIVAGTLGLILGPSALGLLPVESSVLEAGVYHGLALVFIALALETPSSAQKRGGDGASMGFAIVTMFTAQSVLGLALAIGLGLVLAGGVHPGVGLLLPNGFEEGPGQALSFGSNWESTGLTDGGQVGLIIAAVGFAWSVLFGVPLVLWGKKQGLVGKNYDASGSEEAHQTASTTMPPGSLERLTQQLVVIALCYLITYGICAGLASVAGNVIWGVHFILGAVVALGVRGIANRIPGEKLLDNALLGRFSGVCVDFMTCAALTAVQLAVLRSNLAPILIITVVGGLVTLPLAVWFARRAFRQAPFEHAVLWFGMSTGTLPMGLALLRTIDPELKSPVPTSAVIGSAAAIPGVGIAMAIQQAAIYGMPFAKVAAWTPSTQTAAYLALGTLCLYLVGLVVAWWLLGYLKITGPVASLWPADTEPVPVPVVAKG